MTNPWDIALRSPKGDATATPLYEAVGIALSNWELLETALSNVYTTIINSNSRAAVAAYGTILTTAGRISMIEAAAAEERGVIDAPLFAELKKLIVSDVGKMAGRRNEIAHGSVTEFIGLESAGHYLVPPQHSTRKHLSPREPAKVEDFPFGQLKYAYTAGQILRYADSFYSHALRIYDLQNRIAVARERLVKAQLS